MTVLWDIVLCNLIKFDQHFGGDYSLHHRGSDGRSIPRIVIFMLATTRTWNLTEIVLCFKTVFERLHVQNIVEDMQDYQEKNKKWTEIDYQS
jgi:hypothetical protein